MRKDKNYIEEQIIPLSPWQRKQKDVALFGKNDLPVDIDVESELRNFLYSPEGIASVVAINYMGGEPIVSALFAILVAYDIDKWIDAGEPNWLYLITDLICMGTFGFASSIAKPLIQAAKNLKFKSSFDLIKWISIKSPSIFKNYVLPTLSGIKTVVGKVASSLIKFSKILPKTISEKISKIGSKLNEILINFDKTLSRILTEPGSTVGKTYAKYKTTQYLAKKASETKTGQKIIQKSLPYINPLLGADKIDPFLLDLISNTQILELKKYQIHPIFLDNSKDGF